MRYWYEYYGEPLDPVKKAELTKAFNAFLKTMGPSKQATNYDIQATGIGIKAEVSGQSEMKNIGQSLFGANQK